MTNAIGKNPNPSKFHLTAEKINDAASKAGGVIDIAEKAAKAAGTKAAALPGLAGAAAKARGAAEELGAASKSVAVLGAVTAGIDAYEKSPAKSKGAKLANAGLAAGAEGLVSATPGVGLVDGAMALAGAEGLRPSRLARGAADGVTALGAAATGDQTAMPDFNHRAQRGEYGLVVAGAAVVGEVIADVGDATMRRFSRPVKI
ncbi:MAG: hypothetical protein HY791_03740 [Deltaproteobacteria bacterium]|nr:hypothetical protein [Deltaproteobacteria bacterium]